MTDQNTDSSILATGLHKPPRLESGGLGSTAWNDGTEETIADLAALGESILKLEGIVRPRCRLWRQEIEEEKDHVHTQTVIQLGGKDGGVGR